MSFHKRRGVSQYIHEAYSIRKETDIPGLPEKLKKLYQNFRLVFFHLYINVAFIFQRLYM